MVRSSIIAAVSVLLARGKELKSNACPLPMCTLASEGMFVSALFCVSLGLNAVRTVCSQICRRSGTDCRCADLSDWAGQGKTLRPGAVSRSHNGMRSLQNLQRHPLRALQDAHAIMTHAHCL